MESSAYVDRTLASVSARVDRLSPRVGMALQAYLRRTRARSRPAAVLRAGDSARERRLSGTGVDRADAEESEIDESYYQPRGTAADGGGQGQSADYTSRRTTDASSIASTRSPRRMACRRRSTNTRCCTASSGRCRNGCRAEGKTHARADRLRRQLVPVVHASAGGASGQSLVHRQEFQDFRNLRISGFKNLEIASNEDTDMTFQDLRTLLDFHYWARIACSPQSAA